MEETFNIPSDEKADIDAKAKKKFLENLHKFQEKTANQTSFRRSYRTADGQAAGMSKHMRRSHRLVWFIITAYRYIEYKGMPYIRFRWDNPVFEALSWSSSLVPEYLIFHCSTLEDETFLVFLR